MAAVSKATLPLKEYEKALLIGKWDGSIGESQSPVSEIVQKVVNGEFKSALTSSFGRDLLKPKFGTKDPFAVALNSWFSFEDSQELNEEENELLRLSIGVASLHSFIQVNWTGPDLDIAPAEIIFGQATPSSDEISEKSLNRKAISELAHGGEPAYHLAQVATFLRLAQLIFSQTYKLCQSAAWWRLRVVRVHQHILDEPVPFPDSVTSSLKPLYSALASDRDLVGRLTLEHGLLEHDIGQDKLSLEQFVRSAKLTGLEYELTGALGRRTKFQETSLSQLVLLAESRARDGDGETSHSLSASHHDGRTAQLDEERAAVSGPASSSAILSLPETLALNDDTLLERTEFTSSPAGSDGSKLRHLDPSSQPPLHPLDQCILLSLCLNVKNTSPSHGLTAEQMSPYVERVITHPQNWSIHTMALLLRSRLESTRTRTVERSVLQLQALVDQMPTADSTLSERLLYFHALPLPSKWELERDLALRFLELGVVKSAMEIFERLEMWEEVVKCWQSIERPDKGLEIVQDLLEGRKEESDAVILRGKAVASKRRQVLDINREAKLWCLLGDLEPQKGLEHYERAWTLSKETSGRAMRSMGGYHFTREHYPKAIECLRKALAINPLLSRPWFILGCSCVRLERWEEARDAFSRCVALDDEDGESWNNLASVYLRMGASKSEKQENKPGNNNSDAKIDEDGEASELSAPSVPFSNKLLAFRALRIGLKYSYDNWRMWTNYMIVAMDVAEFAEACRAQARLVEERSSKVGAAAVDEELLDKLVDAVTRVPSSEADGAASEASTSAGGAATSRSPNEGHGLLPRVLDLLEKTILPRVSSQRIFTAYARLLMWQGRWSEALKAHLDAFRMSSAATMEKGAEVDLERWREAVREVEDIVDVLQNFGPRAEAQEAKEVEHQDGRRGDSDEKPDMDRVAGKGAKWKGQARSIVRTFMARTRDSFEGDPYWEKLTQLQVELRK